MANATIRLTVLDRFNRPVGETLRLCGECAANVILENPNENRRLAPLDAMAILGHDIACDHCEDREPHGVMPTLKMERGQWVLAMLLALLLPSLASAQSRGWFVLVDVWGTRNSVGDGPKHFGPYASQEACRIAANRLAPQDERFWPADMRIAARESRQRDYLAAQSRKGADILLAMAKKGYHPGTLITLPNGGKVIISASGEETWKEYGWAYGSGLHMLMQTCPCYTALTICEFLPKP